MVESIDAPRATALLRFAAKSVRAILAVIGLATTLILVTPIDQWWAQTYAGSLGQPNGNVFILLSAAADDDGMISYSSYWRARYALLAWRNRRFQTLVISGEGGRTTRDLLVAEGIPAQSILVEDESLSTRENGLDTARIINQLPGTKVLLTSDFHMFRALRVFRKLGINVEPYAIPDVLKSSQHWYGRLSAFHTLLFETVKIVDYRWNDWI